MTVVSALREFVNSIDEVDQDADQYLTFTLGQEDYGVDILRVQEIRGWEKVTRIPNAPDYVKGVLNLRGAIVPIFDLRQRFGMPREPYSKDTVVIVLLVRHQQHRERSVGVVVDAVSNVLNAKHSDIRAAPDFGGRLSTEYIKGLISAENKMVMVIDVDRLMGQGILDDSQDSAEQGEHAQD